MLLDTVRRQFKSKSIREHAVENEKLEVHRLFVKYVQGGNIFLYASMGSGVHLCFVGATHFCGQRNGLFTLPDWLSVE